MVPSEEDETPGDDLAQSCAHEAGHVCIAMVEEAEVEWARAKLAGTGTTKLKDQESLRPLTQARIAVAGSVCQQEICGGPERPLRPSDTKLLAQALHDLDDPDVTEETLRREVRSTIERHRPSVLAVATALSRQANAKVSGEDLADVFTNAAPRTG